MKTIQWLIGLEKGKLIIALLIIATAALFTQNQVKENQINVLNKAYREDLSKRQDSCEANKLKIIQEDRKKIEGFLEELLRRSESTERELDSTVHHNRTVIKTTKSEVKRVKKLIDGH